MLFKIYALALCSFLALLLCESCSSSLPQEIAKAMDEVPEEVDYNFHVKPILSDRCFACHGPDAQNQEADLRLDNAEGAYAALTSGNGHAIVAGKLEKSQLFQRIISKDMDLVMPPPESNLQLNAKEKAILIRWIEQGAVYKSHWAFTPMVSKVAVPVLSAAATKNEIDNFVFSRLAEKGIQPSPEAERAQLIRRVYFDLNGLPPTSSEVIRWANDPSTDWYERLVDELLARPAYGERMAAYWMDVARFADSEGYLDDFHHALWPYRDWVIKAYNDNLPHNRFVEWQIAGDLLPNATQEQVLATTFNRTHKQNSEGGIIPEEFRVEYVADRANTVGAAFMGLTVGCARCHDHKYDPISQKDYYSLYSFFNNTVERGDAVFGGNAVENGQEISNFYSMNAGPTLQLADSTTKVIQAHLEQMIAEKESVLVKEAASISVDFSSDVPDERELRSYVQYHSIHHLTFDEEVLRDLAPKGKANHDWLPRGEGKFGKAIVCGGGQVAVEGSRSSFERSEPFTISFWLHAPEFYEEAHFMYNANHRIQGYRGWDVTLDSNRVHVRLNHAHPYQSIDLRIDEPLTIGEWSHFVWSYDGSSTAEGMRVYRDGEQVQPTIIRDHLVRSTKPYTSLDGTIYMGYSGFVIGDQHYDDDFNGGSVDEVRVLDVEAGDLLARYLYDAPFGRTIQKPDVVAVQEYKVLHREDRLADYRQDLMELRTRAVETIDTVQEIMVMGDDTRLRPTYILERGVYDAHGKAVYPDVPAALLPWSEDLPRNRLGLAKWLTQDENPLTARVAVNQLWYLMFGRGIVESVEDFGNQGALPSHPALLDWLATDYITGGWDTKKMIRKMVTSATYRQSSVVRPELAEVDPDNVLLARGPRYRRSAEMIRDNILYASGLLDDKVGGNSVFPYQPNGLWRETTNHPFFPGYQVDFQKGLYRRSLYTFWKRNMPPPNMLIFDASTRGECQVRRQRSNTPLQALALLNDEQMIEGCRVLAENVWRESDGLIPTATEALFLKLIGRSPNSREQAIMYAQYRDELSYFSADDERWISFLSVGYRPRDPQLPPSKVAALARVANTVLNTTESYYKN